MAVEMLWLFNVDEGEAYMVPPFVFHYDKECALDHGFDAVAVRLIVRRNVLLREVYQDIVVIEHSEEEVLVTGSISAHKETIGGVHLERGKEKRCGTC